MAELELYYLFQDGDCTYAVGYSAIYVRVPYSLQEYYILLDTVRSCSGSGRNSAAFLASNNNLSARLVGVGRVMNEMKYVVQTGEAGCSELLCRFSYRPELALVQQLHSRLGIRD